jgi:hypothetical protein
MPIFRVKEIALGVLVATLAGCGGLSRLQSEPSHSIELSGNWLLDRAASDDPQKVFDRLRPKPTHHEDSDENAASDGDNSGSSGNPPAGGGPRRRRGGGDQQLQTAGNRNDAYARTPLLRMLASLLARGDQVIIHQSGEVFSLDYGNTTRTFTPGGQSVVSAEWGVADQISGWKGKEYVIQVKPQNGVPLTESFSLSEDGNQLIDQLRVGGGEFPLVQLKRVYNRTDRPLSRGVPIND